LRHLEVFDGEIDGDDPGILGRFCPGGAQSTVKPISGLFSGDSFWSSMETSIV
jgi:hypothetical protein